MADATITIQDIPTQTEGAAVKTVAITGQLDESNVDEKAKTIYQMIESHPQNLYIIFDLGGLDYMNSKAIGYLTDWYGKVTEHGGKLVMAKVKPNVLDVLEVVGLTQLIKSYSTIDEAKVGLSS